MIWMGLLVVPLYLYLLAVFLLPGLGVIAQLARRNRVGRPLYSLILLLVTSASVGYLAFWIYFAGRTAGRLFTFVVELASVGLLWHALRSAEARACCRALSLPLLYVAAVGACYVSLLYVVANPFVAQEHLANWRFFSPMRPEDNVIPWYFAQKIYAHQSLIPFCCVDWLSSDRPPLQAGVFLFSWPLKVIRGTGLSYQLTGTALQCLWICGVWAILQALGESEKRFRQVLAFTVPSAFLFYNSLYPWPKSLAAAFILFTFAIVILAVREGRPLTNGETILGASCLGLALMAHPGSVFSLPCLVLLLVYRRSVPWRSLGWALLVLASFSLPWAAYQKFVDPPGNRLIKMHLAGVGSIDSRSTWQAIHDSYMGTPLRRIFENKFDNLSHVVGPHPFSGFGLREKRLGPGDFEAVDYREGVRVDQREYIWNALGVLVVGLVVIPVAALRKWRPAIACSGLLLACAALNLVVWSLVTFGPFETVTTHSSYADTLLLMIGLIGFILPLPRPLVLIIALGNAANTAIVWIPFTPHSPRFPSHLQWPLLCLGALLGISLLAHLLLSLVQREVVANDSRQAFTAASNGDSQAPRAWAG